MEKSRPQISFRRRNEMTLRTTTLALIMALLMSTSTVLTPGPVSILHAQEQQQTVLTGPELFMKDLKGVYLTPSALQSTTVGIEVEMNGVSADSAKVAVQAVLGGRIEGDYVRGTRLGDVRVYHEGAMWQ